MSMLRIRTSGLSMLLATGLLACGSDGGSGGEDGSSSSGTPQGSSSGTAAGGTSSQGTDSSGVTGTTTTPASTSTGLDDSSSTQAGSDTGSSGSTTGGSSLPIDCEDGELPVRVDGGGAYETVSEGVAATAPGGTLWVCPGDYEEDAEIQIERDISIVGAGPALVSIVGTAAVNRVFFVRDASVTFEGLSISGGFFGINVAYLQNEARTTTMRNLRVGENRQAGIYLSTGPAVDDGAAQAVFEDVVVENVAAQEKPVAIAGVALLNVDATFLDTIIRDNLTRSGGLEIDNSEVTFEGGQVIRNEATFPNGGGARLTSDAPFPQFTIVDSDWGEGAAQENIPNDVDCGAGANNDIGWLGSPANAVCATNTGDCCTPT